MLTNKSLDSAYVGRNKPVNGHFNYGYGWRMFDGKGMDKVVYHTGWWHGNRHIYFKIPSKDYTVIILSNSLKGSTYNLNEMLEVFYHVN